MEHASNFNRLLKGIGRGIVGIFIWPISMIMSCRKMIKMYRDPEVDASAHICCDRLYVKPNDPYQRLTFQDNVCCHCCSINDRCYCCLIDCCKLPPIRHLTDMAEYYMERQYQMSYSFFKHQISTHGFVFFLMPILCFFISFMALDLNKNEPDYLNRLAKASGKMTACLFPLGPSVYGLLVMPFQPEVYLECYDAVKDLITSCIQKRVSNQFIFRQRASRYLSDIPSTVMNPKDVILSIKRNNPRASLCAETKIDFFSTRLNAIHQTLKETNFLENECNKIVLSYLFSPRILMKNKIHVDDRQHKNDDKRDDNSDNPAAVSKNHEKQKSGFENS